MSNLKTGSFNNKTYKITIKYECRADNKIFFSCYASKRKLLFQDYFFFYIRLTTAVTLFQDAFIIHGFPIIFCVFRNRNLF